MTATSEEEVRHDTIYFSGSVGCGIPDFQCSPAFVGKSRGKTGSGEAAGAQPEDSAEDVPPDSAYQRSKGYSKRSGADSGRPGALCGKSSKLF